MHPHAAAMAIGASATATLQAPTGLGLSVATNNGSPSGPIGSSTPGTRNTSSINSGTTTSSIHDNLRRQFQSPPHYSLSSDEVDHTPEQTVGSHHLCSISIGFVHLLIHTILSMP
jgi:hypothetical protein